MNNLYDVLEICLQELESGADLDTILLRYPELADELRPILEASRLAKSAAIPAPSADVVRRNRAKVLQHAVQLREARASRSRRFWTVPLRRAFVSLAVIGILFISSTGLVRAASTTLPGDNLYPVKRTWEDVVLLFTFNTQTREVLEVEHENERLDELKDLFAEGRSVQVDFSGQVTLQNGDLWLIAGIPVAISSVTELPAQAVQVGSAVHVLGVTQKNGLVLAQRIDLLPVGVPLPEINDDSSNEVEPENTAESNQSSEHDSNSGSGNEAPQIEPTDAPKLEPGFDSATAEPDSHDETLTGVVESINGSIVVVNGQILNLSFAEIEGTPRVGASVKVEGYYDASGLFIATKIEFISSGSEGGDVSGDGSSDHGSHEDDGSKDTGGSDGGGDAVPGE